MSKLFIAALLAVFSTSAMAEWTSVGGNDTTVNYADRSTIRKSGNKVKMWDLIDFKVVKISKNDENDDVHYLSMATQFEYDCKEETAKILTFNWYSKNMGAGEVVNFSGALHEEPVPISPSSIIEVLFKLACGK